MPAEVFWDSTLREVVQFMEAAQWRQQHQARMYRYAAYHAAYFQRVKADHFPSLQKVLGLSTPARRQSADEQLGVLKEWKAVLEAKGLVVKVDHQIGA
ncbi:MAG TPA: hypothetical protein VJ735_20110 [Actinomycetes bacterium]|nr:hypothetical protein [Actinomycetes bacterium]